MRKLLLALGFILSLSAAKADEGMWLLKELNKQSIARMKELGFTFPTDSIYSETNPSLKDAVVIFGRGCTGVAVSDQGLIFTNHHCGYDDIQKLSSVEHDYLKNGFVSQSFEEELPAHGLSVSFLKTIEDITDFVTTGISPTDGEEARNIIIDSLSNVYLEKYENEEFLKASVVPFYAQNKYYVVVYEVFRDVRLAFTPPSSIGKFGGETDNWMWPRHTGDFSVFRVYANEKNEAASYSPDNVPYKPRYSVPVSIQGYEDKDYAMTIGYPGSTERYMSSWGIKQMVESEHKPRIAVRGAKQEIWKNAMNASDAIRIKYASKYAGSSNYWKNAMGMNEAIAKLNVIEGKEKFESEFAKWVASKPELKERYGETLQTLKDAYTNTMQAQEILTYFGETFYNGIEIVRYANTVLAIKKQMEEGDMEVEGLDLLIESVLKSYYKDYESSLDRQVMPVLMELYRKSVPAEYLPDVYKTIDKKFKGDCNKYAEWFYKNTKFTDLTTAVNFINKGKDKDFKKDPAVELAKSLDTVMEDLYAKLEPYMMDMDKGSRQFMAGIMEMQPDKAFYSDANFTQRLSYGSVGGYEPSDAVTYDYYTTSKGVLEKENADNPEFAVQQYILDDLSKGDFGRYAAKDGKMYVNFLSNNDITGGNSGSPVFNGKAHLIGLAFDGNWEALSGDILFEPDVQRTISVDIRYVLYVIDKVMNCPRIINELNVIQ